MSRACVEKASYEAELDILCANICESSTPEHEISPKKSSQCGQSISSWIHIALGQDPSLHSASGVVIFSTICLERLQHHKHPRGSPSAASQGFSIARFYGPFPVELATVSFAASNAALDFSSADLPSLPAPSYYCQHADI